MANRRAARDGVQTKSPRAGSSDASRSARARCSTRSSSDVPGAAGPARSAQAEASKAREPGHSRAAAANTASQSSARHGRTSRSATIQARHAAQTGEQRASRTPCGSAVKRSRSAAAPKNESFARRRERRPPRTRIARRRSERHARALSPRVMALSVPAGRARRQRVPIRPAGRRCVDGPRRRRSDRRDKWCHRERRRDDGNAASRSRGGLGNKCRRGWSPRSRRRAAARQPARRFRRARRS